MIQSPVHPPEEPEYRKNGIELRRFSYQLREWKQLNNKNKLKINIKGLFPILHGLSLTYDSAISPVLPPKQLYEVLHFLDKKEFPK